MNVDNGGDDDGDDGDGECKEIQDDGTNPYAEKNQMVLDELNLKGAIDSRHLTGVQFSKCCHQLHLDCLV